MREFSKLQEIKSKTVTQLLLQPTVLNILSASYERVKDLANLL